ncbi:MAG: endolytic transglycosylase MltG [Polyangiaceae bacterium]
MAKKKLAPPKSSRKKPVSSSPPRSSTPPRKRRASDWRLSIGSVLTVFGVLVAFAAGLLFVVYPSRPVTGAGHVIAVELKGNETADSLAETLAVSGVIQSTTLFSVFARARGVTGTIAPGVHLFTDTMTPSEVLARVERYGAGPKTKVPIPEGWTRFDIAKRLEMKGICPANRFLAVSQDPALLAQMRLEATSFEGYLFPATYDFAEDSAPDAVVKAMKLEFDRRYSAAEDRHAAAVLDLEQSLHFTEREIVTLASMIEKEAAVDDERGTIAGVFLNRLRDPKFTPKLLQCDPTAGYGCLVTVPPLASCATFNGKITHEIVADPNNMYNTYKHEGLPPGPIANPGIKSIEAAMDATPSHYFYFVAKGGGRHTFSETYAAHSAAVDHGKEPIVDASGASE